jgi:DNA repair exonuclease SbcCD ATPase subunit
MYGQIYNVLKEFQLKVKKEDTDSFNESLTAISKLQGIMQEIESKVEEKKERYKKTVAQLVPKLDNEINEHYDKAQDPKYLDGNNIEKMFDIIQELNDIEAQFKELEERKDTYNKYQEVLETQQTVFENLEDCREQITLRCLMWNSLDEWSQMNEKWKKTQFSLVDAE